MDVESVADGFFAGSSDAGDPFRGGDNVLGSSASMYGSCASKPCPALWVYVAFAVVAVLMALFKPVCTAQKYHDEMSGQKSGGDMMTRLGRAGMTALFALAWGLVIWYFCAQCCQGWAWVLVLLPVVVGILVVVLSLGAIGYMESRTYESCIKRGRHGRAPMRRLQPDD